MTRDFYYRENPNYYIIDVIDSDTGEVHDQIESMHDAMQELNSLAMELFKLKGKEIKFNSYGDSKE